MARLFLAILLFSSSSYALPHSVDSLLDSFKSWAHLAKPSVPPMLNFWRKRDVTGTTSDATNATNAASGAVWLIKDTYAGKTFYDDWIFYTGPDPTRGLVTYVDRDTAFANKLVYVEPDGTVIMKGDNTSWLADGQNRSSVRISSTKTYTGGLFILDLNRAPWGCATWPAFWTFAKDAQWPTGGEIDIIEGVHDNIHNQVAWHTQPGCNLTVPGNFTGTALGQIECNALINSNAGCGITDWSRVSYGATFDAQGGGLYVMKWDEEGIAVWYFYRVSIPQDILDGVPNPKSWNAPSAQLLPQACDLSKYFFNHQIVFDITFCGDWAGSSYENTPGCPGTCRDRLKDPNNFVNATWSINNLKVYQKQSLFGVVTNAAVHGVSEVHSLTAMVLVVAFCTFIILA